MTWKVGYNLFSEDAIIFKPTELNSDQLREKMCNGNFHLYLLCTRKRIIYHSSYQWDRNYGITNYYTLNQNDDKVFFTIPHLKGVIVNSYDKIKRKLNVSEDDGKTDDLDDYVFFNSMYYDRSLAELRKIFNPNPLVTDLKVEYVGQSYGRKSKREIDKRLTNHEKLQEIAFKIIDKGTHEEVYCIGLTLGVKDLSTAYVPLDRNVDRKDFSVDGIKKLQKKASRRLQQGQEITLYEASLINYFQPTYNTEYKETFPSPDFDSYNEIYSTEFNYSTMVVDAHPVMTRLYTDVATTRKCLHSNEIILSDNESKRNLFEYLFN